MYKRRPGLSRSTLSRPALSGLSFGNSLTGTTSLNVTKNDSKVLNSSQSKPVASQNEKYSKEVASDDEVEPSQKRQKANIGFRESCSLAKQTQKQLMANKPVCLTYMEEVLQNCGFFLSNGKSYNVLKKDQAVFVRDLTLALTSDERECSRNIENFKKDLEKYCSNNHNFKNALTPTETSTEIDIARGATQDCLMRLILQVDPLQSSITDFLLDKMAEFVMDSDKADEDTSVITWVRMILQCLRFLDRDVNSTKVCDLLFDIIHGSTDQMIQQEVINCLPDIIGDSEHHTAALELSKLVRSTPTLLASVLEALNNLSLQSEVRSEVQAVLIKALRKVQPEYLPNMIKFLFTSCDPANTDEIISSLRSEMVFTDAQTDTGSSVQVLVVSNLKNALLASKHLPDTWLKNINSVRIHHKPIDFIMLLVLYSTSTDAPKQRAIETAFRNKIRSGLFNESLIQETFRIIIPVVKEYFMTLMKIAALLLKSPEPVVAEFAASLYSELFVNLEGYWCKWVVTELQVYIGAGDSVNTRSALNILQDLTINHLHKIKPFAVLLMMLVNKLNELQLSEVRQLMDVLWHVAYTSLDEGEGSDDCSALEDELSMLVQKQLGSSQLSILRNGVVGSVMAIKHMATTSTRTSKALDSSQLSEKAKRAVPLLERVLTGTRSNFEALALALDQLSHMLMGTKNLDASLLQYMSTLMRDNMQESYLICPSDFSPKNDLLELSAQFCLDKGFENEIMLNLGELATKEAHDSKHHRSSSSGTMPLICLHPLIRLLRGLESNDLSEIDALLGCAVTMPNPDVYTNFSTLSPYQQHIALNCLFYCINWFREILNTFSLLIKNNEPDKVLIRLRTIVWLQGILSKCLSQTVEYTPPICLFQQPSKPLTTGEKATKKPNKGTKRKRSEKKQELAGDASALTGGVDVNAVDDEDKENNEPTFVEEITTDLQKYKHYFRELDIDVWLIFTQPLTLNCRPEKDGEFSAELGPSELLYLLNDYADKINHMLSPTAKRISFLKTANQNIGFEYIDHFNSVLIAKNSIKLIPYLCNYLEKTMEYIHNLLQANDGILDATGMFGPDSAEIKQCQARILQIISSLFAWSGFQNQAHSDLLLAGLQKLASRVNAEHSKSSNKKLLIRECVQYLSQCEEKILYIPGASALVSLIKALVKHVDDLQLNNNISTISFNVLCRNWYDLNGSKEKGTVFNNHVNALLMSHLTCSENCLETITKTMDWLVTEVQELNEKDSALKTFPVYSKLNLNFLIDGLLKGLDSGVKQGLENDLTDKQKLNVWLNLTLGLETLVAVVKIHDTKPNLKAFLKGSTILLRLFLSQGIPVCTYMFKYESAIVSQVLKKLQVTTRYIQTICNFVKVSRDGGLAQYLPPVRAVMESILLRVKSIIVINNCGEAFYMGTMKNRDLKGEEIPSQTINDEPEVEITVDSDGENDTRATNNEDGSPESISQAC